jgi:23S rRNA pseudoU1915 N3-methylase RlmH
MKTHIKESKTKTYFKFNNEFFSTSHNYEDFNFEKLNIENLQEQQSYSLKSEISWREIGDFDSLIDAKNAYVLILIEERLQKKLEHDKFAERIEKEKKDAWLSLAALEIIPATIENLRIVLNHLNTQNWGSWVLPKMSIGYLARQYDCDGITATTIELDKPISDEENGIQNETMFKIGGKQGHLTKYRRL